MFLTNWLIRRTGVAVDVDVYVARHRSEWSRLELLVRKGARPRRLSGDEFDELVDLYQRATTHLSVIRTRSPDPSLVDALSGLVTRARSVVAGARDPSWRAVSRFLLVTFPAAVYLRRWWILVTSVACVAVALALGVWIANDTYVAGALQPAEQVRALCDTEFANYYSSHPAGSFAAQVWTNNVWVAAGAICLGVLFGLPSIGLLLFNSINVGLSGGYMASCGKTGEFFSLILPHGMLELTAVFAAGATGIRMGWRIIDPGPRRRSEALAEEGRSAVGIALGLIVYLAISGVLEAFLTPSPLPPWARLTSGFLVWAVVLGGTLVLGRRAVRGGATGDLEDRDIEARAPVSV
ncbi:MAG: hypothetical protein QOG60_2188 [Frankiaceae bacterium]|nr:hypothetical protein [Frankiaceae bacterium]